MWGNSPICTWGPHKSPHRFSKTSKRGLEDPWLPSPWKANPPFLRRSEFLSKNFESRGSTIRAARIMQEARVVAKGNGFGTVDQRKRFRSWARVDGFSELFPVTTL